MQVENYDKNYQIRDYSMKRNDNKEIILKWKYTEGTHFLILLYDGREEIRLGDIVKEMNYDKGGNDEKIMQEVRESNNHCIYTTHNRKVKLFLVQEGEFKSRGECYVIDCKKERMPLEKIPYGLSVFIGKYNEKEKIMHLYEVENSEMNTQFIPVKIKPKITYFKSIFKSMFSSEQLCVLFVPPLSDYIDGAIQYHIDGVKMTYPLSVECLGKKLFIKIPKGSSIIVRVAEEYKKYYKV